MHRPIYLILLALALACTRPLASVDDEAGVTTNIGEESTDEESIDSGSTTSTDTSSTTEWPGFVTAFDMPLEPQDCDPFEQDCPPGEKCVLYASSGDFWDSNKCVPVLGDQQPGDPCTWDGIVEATDDCDATSMCWDVMDIDGELMGQCMAFCQGTPDEPECPDGSSCLISSESSPAICITNCDPLLQDCGAGLGCYWANTGFSCVFRLDDIPTGEPCGYINDCAPGNYCTDAAALPDCAGAACCTNYCDLKVGGAECSEPDTACMNFFELGMAPPGYEDVGVCVLPP